MFLSNLISPYAYNITRNTCCRGKRFRSGYLQSGIRGTAVLTRILTQGRGREISIPGPLEKDECTLGGKSCRNSHVTHQGVYNGWTIRWAWQWTTFSLKDLSRKMHPITTEHRRMTQTTSVVSIDFLKQKLINVRVHCIQTICLFDIILQEVRIREAPFVIQTSPKPVGMHGYSKSETA